MASAEEIQKLLEGPGLKPPPGVISNFVDPPSQYGVNVFTKAICPITATISVIIRMYTRVRITDHMAGKTVSHLANVLLLMTDNNQVPAGSHG